MDLSEFKDEYGYIIDIDSVMSSSDYQNLSDVKKAELLISIIDSNSNNLKKNSSLFMNISENECKSGYSNFTISDVKSWKLPDITMLLHYDNCDDMIRDGLLPERNSSSFDKKIKTFILAIRNELEEYESIKYEDDEDFFKEQREEYQRLLDLLIDYNTYDDDIHIDVQNDFSVFYMPNNLNFDSESNLSPLIKDISKNNKQDVLLTMVDSIKQQEFKGLKRFTKPFSEFYELRNGQQRVVFNFLTPNIAVIIFALTKKSNSDKRYRGELLSRASKYRRMKSQLKRAIASNNAFLEQQRKIEEAIYNNTCAKSLVKVRDCNE